MDVYNGQGSNTTELLGGGQDKAEADADTVKSKGDFADISATSEAKADYAKSEKPMPRSRNMPEGTSSVDE